MNKQEAIVALLERARKWEGPSSEVRLTPIEEIFDQLFTATAELLGARAVPATPLLEQKIHRCLVTVGAAALRLLADQTEPVKGRELEEWLAAGGVLGER